MLDHVSIPVTDLEKSASFYDAVLATVGFEPRKRLPGAIGYGPPDQPAPVFWILSNPQPNLAKPGIGLHISFQAHNRESVDAFHSVALSLGGTDAGLPGERPQYTQPFYGAFIFDPDGFKIEAVCRQ